jgi:hypothetical protein
LPEVADSLQRRTENIRIEVDLAQARFEGVVDDLERR